jgi:hypothetical protein
MRFFFVNRQRVDAPSSENFQWAFIPFFPPYAASETEVSIGRNNAILQSPNWPV